MSNTEGSSSSPVEDDLIFPGMMESLRQLCNSQNSTNGSQNGSPQPTETVIIGNLLSQMQEVQNKLMEQQPSTSEQKTLPVLKKQTFSDVWSNGRDTPGPMLPAFIMQQKAPKGPGRFLWLWFLGLQLPSFSINGEPCVPLEILLELVKRIDPENALALERLIKDHSIYTEMCISEQQNKIKEKCKEKEELKDLDLSRHFSQLSLVSRSDIELMMGMLRNESLRTKCETDIWDDSKRVEIAHLNFLDYCEEWLENEDLEEDVTAYGVIGWWYKDRRSMRCIKCKFCDMCFIPNDFVAHYDRPRSKDEEKKPLAHPIKAHLVKNVGLDTNNWAKMIVLRDPENKENAEAWRKFAMNSHGIGKRAYDDAEPVAPKRIALEKTIIDDDDLDIEIDEEASTERMEYEPIEEMIVPGLSEAKKNDEYETQLWRAFNKVDKETKLAFLTKTEADFAIWIKEREFTRKVAIQNELWQKIREHPKFVCTATAHFDSEKACFVNLHLINNAPKAIKREIQKLTEEFVKMSKDKNLSVWDRVKKEQQLIGDLTTNARLILSNRPIPPPPPPPMPKPKAIQPVAAPVPPIQPVPISLANINWQQIAQQLIASGIKIPLPQVTLPQVTLPQIPVSQVSPVVSTPVVAADTPATPPTPVVIPKPVLPTQVLPAMPSILPIMQNPDLLKAQLQLALSSPALLPILYPNQYKLPSFEQISQFLKATAVKN